MSDDIRDDAIKEARSAAEHWDNEKDISLYKILFRQQILPHLALRRGKSLNAYVSYQAKQYIFFYVKQIAVFL